MTAQVTNPVTNLAALVLRTYADEVRLDHSLRMALKSGGAFSAEMEKAMAEAEGMEGCGLERRCGSLDGHPSDELDFLRFSEARSN